ncbi:ARM repeat-containing protein [Panus rudis PR-1116 ss-1]|nr:ARM repeat-containing protein [Panus rudis PR-1116 ss-1]
MGIVLSLLFPRNLMFTQPSSSSSSSPASSRSTSPQPFHDALSDLDPEPSPFYTPSSSPPPPPEHLRHPSPQIPGPIMESPPLDPRPVSTHFVGSRVVSPRPTLGPFFPFHRDQLAQRMERLSPAQVRYNPFDSPSRELRHSPFAPEHTSPADSPAARSGSPNPSQSIAAGPSSVSSPAREGPPSLAKSAGDDGPSTSSDVSSDAHLPPTAVSVQSPPSTGEPADVTAHGASEQPSSARVPSLQPSLPPPPFRPPSPSLEASPSHQDHNPFRRPAENSTDMPPSIDLTRDPALHSLPGPASSLTPSNPMAVSADPLGHDVGTSAEPPQFDFGEFESEGLSALEKIYLFSRSSMSFHRAYIAKALAGFLRGNTEENGTATDTSSNTSHESTGDRITPEEAVEYVLPLLNGLAMDEDDSVKEALAAELVPIIWWFVTRCKLVEDDSIPQLDANAEHVPQVPGEHGVHGYPREDHLHVMDQHPFAYSPSALSHPPPGPSHLSGHQEHEQPTPQVVSPTPIRADSAGVVRPPTPRPPTPIPAPDLPLRPATPAPPEPPPTRISVQSFTPILGTLLLSTNAHIGGPARYAVVELLKRVRRADEAQTQADAEEAETRGRSQSPTSQPAQTGSTRSSSSGSSSSKQSLRSQRDDPDGSDEEYSPVGLFGEAERRMFEREMVHQVVIGMGRLDIPDDNMQAQDDSSQSGSAAGTPLTGSTPGIPTPHPRHPAETPYSSGPTDSYFPLVSPPSEPPSTEAVVGSDDTIQKPSPQIWSPTPSSPSPGAFVTARLSSPPLDLPSTSPHSPSQTPSSISPTHSPFTTPSPAPSSSTPSLTSGSSSSSDAPSPYSFAAITPPPDELEPSPAPLSPTAPSVPLPQEIPQQLHAPAAQGWVPPRSPGDLPPLSDEERRQWEQHYAPTNFSYSSGGASTWSTDTQSGEGGSQEDADLNEEAAEAAVGRFSSMSLMAAVTASGTLAEDTKTAFVTEVERVGRDPIYWVRREASFAVGALAKVVPVEVVETQLLPLFRSLCTDSMWHVRHSALFALPAILSRLSPQKRRELALEVILPLSQDESATVRSGVLEALAEVMYTFHEDEEGPPPELLRLFLGIREGESERRPAKTPVQPKTWDELVALARSTSGLGKAPEADIYDDPTRPLVCAFNFPAVALTLGKDRWPELRELYLELSLNASFKVRRTLAASLGEIAKIIGPEHAHKDLLGVWWGSMRAPESEVRLKAIECLDVFLGAISAEDRKSILSGILSELWDTKLRGWREREAVMKALDPVVSLEDVPEDVLHELLMKGLQDSASAVREAAVASVPAFVVAWEGRPAYLERLTNSIQELAISSAYRKRMAYIACQQEILLSENYQALIKSETFWQTLHRLADDAIVDVRIRVARFLGLLSDTVLEPSDAVKSNIVSLAERLSRDTSAEVKAFTQPILAGTHPIFSARRESSRTIKSAANFSRPPPPPIN